MPLFGSQKRPVTKSNNAVAMVSAPLPPPPSESPRPHPVMPSRQELVFHCQLAHGSATKEIRDFSNVKLLYLRIAETFSISPDEVCLYVCVCVCVCVCAMHSCFGAGYKLCTCFHIN